MLACLLPEDEDILSNPQSIAYTDRIDKALAPHLDILLKLLDNPDLVPSSEVPAKACLESEAKQKKRLAKQAKISPTWSKALAYNGGLSIFDLAGINNWFYNRVPEAKSRGLEWFERLPIAHARTCFLLYLNRSVFIKKLECTGDSDDIHESQLLQLAWEKQVADSKLAKSADVDREAVEALEKKMFECSLDAGPAGNNQWGLDAGPHQNNWQPYALIPLEWNDGTYTQESDSETQVRILTIYQLFSYWTDWVDLQK
jgi:hypothetical protein